MTAKENYPCTPSLETKNNHNQTLTPTSTTPPSQLHMEETSPPLIDAHMNVNTMSSNDTHHSPIATSPTLNRNDSEEYNDNIQLPMSTNSISNLILNNTSIPMPHSLSVRSQSDNYPPPEYHGPSTHNMDVGEPYHTHHNIQHRSPINENDYEENQEDPQQIEPEDDGDVYDENGEPKFPLADLIKLEEQLNQTRWIVPVLADGELIKCLRAAIKLAKHKIDMKSEPCQRFIRDSLVNSFTKILCDEAVQSWKLEIFKHIYRNCMLFVHLCVLKIEDDCMPLLEILGMLMNPNCRYHQSGHSRQSDYRLPADVEPFALSSDYRVMQRGWLVDFINRFGFHGGFDKVHSRFTSADLHPKLTISIVVSLLKPWGLCYDYLTPNTVKRCFFPIISIVPDFLDHLSENDLKFETKTEPKSDTLSTVIKWLRSLASRIPDNDKSCRSLDALRLKMILRILQTNSFSGKMNALNEVNKLIMSLNTNQRSQSLRSDDYESLTADKLTQWIQDNQILDIVLRDCLHQPQYVEKLEKILRFIIKEHALTKDDLDKIWNSSCGKHEAIEKNVHDLLSKLAWDFSPEQLEHLFECFRRSWTRASKKQREKLLELIRRLAEDDKEGMMANKVLELLWAIAHDEHLPNEIVDQALNAHLKILDYSCLQEKEKTKLSWIEKFMDEVKHDHGHVIISLRQLREICMQFHENMYSQNIPRMMSGLHNRQNVIEQLEKSHQLIKVVTDNLCQYMKNARIYKEDSKATIPEDYYPDGRFNHIQQIQERLSFLKFILKEGHLYLMADYSKSIWKCLAEEAAYPNDRELCFRWFAELVGDDSDIEPTANQDFFQNHLMKLDPNLLTELGMSCFDRFFKSVNAQLHKLVLKRRSIRLQNDENLVGIEYLWQLILNGSDEVAERGITLIKEIYTNISPQLKQEHKRIHQTFISDCLDRLRLLYDDIKAMNKEHISKTKFNHKLNSLIRILVVLREYMSECDNSYHKERSTLPMSRAFRGRPVIIIVRVNQSPNRPADEFEHSCHSNETWGQIRRSIYQRFNTTYGVIELYRNSELIHPCDDNKTLAQTETRDRLIITVRWVQHQSHTGSSGESSSSESNDNNNNSSFSHHSRVLEHPDPLAESTLPSVIFSQNHANCKFLIDLADLGCTEQNNRLRDTARQILDIIPYDKSVMQQLNNCFTQQSSSGEQISLDETHKRLEMFYFHTTTISQLLYNLKVTHIGLMPAAPTTQQIAAVEFLHIRFLHGGGLTCMLNILPHQLSSTISSTTGRSSTTITNPIHQSFTDSSSLKSIYLVVLYICKRLLTILGYYQCKLSQSQDHVIILDSMLQTVPTLTLITVNNAGEQLQQHVPLSLEQKIANYLTSKKDHSIPKSSLLQYTHLIALIRLIWCLAADSSGKYRNTMTTTLETSLKSDFNTIHKHFKQDHAIGNLTIDENTIVDDDDDDEDDESQILACREALEMLSLCIVLVHASIEKLIQEPFFENFLIDLILYCRHQLVRHTAYDQFFLLASRASRGEGVLQYIIHIQFKLLDKTSTYRDDLQIYSQQSNEYFLLLCRLLSFAFANQVIPPDIDKQLNDEIDWLKNVPTTSNRQLTTINDQLLKGHLTVAKELLAFQNSERKSYYGGLSSDGIGQSLIQELIEQFLFPASMLLYQFRRRRLQQRQSQPDVRYENTNDNEMDLLKEPPVAICQTPQTSQAAFDLLVVLGTNCIDNLRVIDDYLTNLFYTVPDSTLSEWDFSPPIGPRPNRGFVGLKNGGATCYMNSVLQQLFMIETLRSALLSVKIPGHYDEETDDDDKRDTSESFADAKSFLKDIHTTTTTTKNSPSNMSLDNNQQEMNENNTNESGGQKTPVSSKNGDRTDYNICILKHIQRIFGHCLESKLQFHIPRGFWKIFKFSGEPVNLREQHDAVEFLNTVVDSVDEALKSLNLPQICSKVLGGTFADQKICKDCPHRYSREEDFTLVSVDIRHSQNLKESLEQYVIGELLDGPNAYFCEKCNKKVDTVKRTCFKKLPPILAIQLKRFDYDWERETPIKFNDYFEFPRELNMEPYTVQGLAKAEGIAVTDDCSADENNRSINPGGMQYKLVGIIVHSGQANGGHYYSFIQTKNENLDQSHWYKFDDIDVSECKMDDDEELRSQCFGGDYPTQTFDQPVMKRQRRWWNAYILFYKQITDSTEVNLEKDLSELHLYDQQQRMPLSVQRSVRRQNIRFLHNRIHFSQEYFIFMKRLVQSNIQVISINIQQQQQNPDRIVMTDDLEELALVSVQIACKFLFSVGWHTKKALRGPASDWSDLIGQYIRVSRKARHFMSEEVLFKHPNRFQEYLIDCTFAEIRNAFGKILVALATSSRQDEQLLNSKTAPTDDIKDYMSVEERILNYVLRLLKTKDFPENVKLLTQYFQFFCSYSATGRHECEQLIRLNVPILFAQMVNDDGQSSCSTMQRYGEPAKLYVILSTLIRCFDVTQYCKPRNPDSELLQNPFYTHNDGGPLYAMPLQLVDIIYKRDAFLKKIIEDSSNCDESQKLLKFLLWENIDVTIIVLNEIIGLLTFYSYDLRTHFDALLLVLMLEDSWQETRLLYALRGMPTTNQMTMTNNIIGGDLSTNNTTSATTTTTTASCVFDQPQSLFEMFTKSKSSYQKRAYQCVKMLVVLFSSCQKAQNLLKVDPDIKSRWTHAVQWLQDQLERSYSSAPGYPYYPSQQGPTTSNDMSQGYFIERTQSARSLLDKAIELCPDMRDMDEPYNSDEDEDISPSSPNLIPMNTGSKTSTPLSQTSVKFPSSSLRPNSPNASNNLIVSPSTGSINQQQFNQAKHSNTRP